MSEKAPSPVTAEACVVEPAPAWAGLAGLTPARVALGRSGVSLPTRELLSFGLAHARARDAVHAALDVPRLRAELEQDGWRVVEVASRAADRAAYLARPDWGRRLDPVSAARLQAVLADEPAAVSPDLVLVLSDGLSGAAVQTHARLLLRALRPKLSGLCLAPLVIATQARVALSDEVGECFGARFAASLIGERPGLSSPDSLGIYLTGDPRVGRTDAERNCISNIHGAGLGYEDAAEQFADRLAAALRGGRTGVAQSAREAALPAPQPRR